MAGANIVLSVIRRPGELFALHREWDSLLTDPGNQFFQSFAFHQAFVRHFTCTEQLRIIVGRLDGRLAGVLPLWLRSGRSYRRQVRVLEPMGAPYAALRGGLSLHGLEEQFGRAAAQLLLREEIENWDVFSSWDLSLRDPLTASFIDELQRSGSHSESFPHTRNVSLDLGRFSSAERYFCSLTGSFRRIIRRSARQLNECGRYCFVQLGQDGKSLKGAMELCERIRAAGWKEPERNRAFLEALAGSAAQEGSLRLFFLCHQAFDRCCTAADSSASPRPPGRGEAAAPPNCTLRTEIPEGFFPIAVTLSLLRSRTALYMRTHYRGDYAKFSPGILLTWHTLEQLIERDGILRVDFLRGDEEYKLQFGGKVDESRYFVRCLNPRLFVLNSVLKRLNSLRSALAPAKKMILSNVPYFGASPPGPR